MPAASTSNFRSTMPARGTETRSMPSSPVERHAPCTCQYAELRSGNPVRPGPADAEADALGAELEHTRAAWPGHELAGVAEGVDGQRRRAKDRLEACPPAADERRLGDGAVVRRRVRPHDVVDAEAAEPVPVGDRPERPVEHLVLREVVLPEPAARNRDPRAREVGRAPVPDGVDHLDAVRRREVLLQVADGRRPVGGPRARVRGRALDVRDHRLDVPDGREGDAGDDDLARSPVAQREQEKRDRDSGEAEARHVGAERRRHDERSDARKRVEDEERPEHAGRRNPPHDGCAEGAEPERREQCARRERVDAAVRERALDDGVERADAEDGRSGGGERALVDPPPDRDSCRHDGEEGEGERAGRERQEGEAREPAEPASLERTERREHERAAERERECARQHDARPDHCEGERRPAGGRAELAAQQDRQCEGGPGGAE